MSYNFQTIDTSGGGFINWHKVGQQVTLKVLVFDPQGGENLQGEKVPRVVGTLLDPTTNYGSQKTGNQPVEMAAGDTVTVDGTLANLRRGLSLAQPARGDVLRLTFTETYAAEKGTGKVITVEHAKGATSSGGDDL